MISTLLIMMIQVMIKKLSLIKKSLQYIASIALLYLCYLVIDAAFKPIPDATIVGRVDYADSIGRQAVDAMIMLDREDFIVNMVSNRDIRDADIAPKILDKLYNVGLDNSIGKVLIYERVLKTSSFDIANRLSFSSFLSWVKGWPREKQIWYAYSMIESSEIPQEWVKKINKYFDAVLVPDKFLVEVYKNCGVTKPIFVLPLPVDLDYILKEDLKTQPNKIFTFGNLSAIHARKNQLLLVQAFHKAFNNDPNVQLILSSRVKKNGYLEEVQNYIKNNNITNIKLNLQKLSKEDYLTTLKSLDCYINISKGEGFSVQPREAMALGIPSIISNNTGQSTIVASGLVLPVKSEIMEPSYNTFLKGYFGVEFNVEIEDVIAQMRNVYTNYQQYLKHSAAMREWVSRYKYENTAPLYQTLVKPSKVILGAGNEIGEDYIVTDAPELVAKYSQLQK